MFNSVSKITLCPTAFESLDKRYMKQEHVVLKAALKMAIIIYSLFKEIVASLYFAFEKLAKSVFFIYADHRIVSQNWLVFKPQGGEEGHVKGHVVLIHGYLHDEGCWTPWVKELLSAGMAVYIPRLDKFHRHGISDYTNRVRELIARDIETKIEKGKLTNAPIHLIGHSMGGLISCDLAGQMPDSFATVSSIGAPLHGALPLARIPAYVHPCVAHMTPGHEEGERIRKGLKGTQAKLQFFSGEYDWIVPPTSAYSREHLESHISVKYCGHLYIVRDERVRKLALDHIIQYEQPQV